MPGIHATQPRLATPVFVLVAIVGAMLGAPAPAAALDFDSFAGDHKAAADNAADVVVLANGTITPPPPPPPGLGSPPPPPPGLGTPPQPQPGPGPGPIG